MKKNIVAGIFFTIFIIISLIGIIRKKDASKQDTRRIKYIEGCKSTLKSNSITEKQKTDLCNCMFDSLYNKYGEEIYNEDFMFTSSDSIMSRNCVSIILKRD